MRNKGWLVGAWMWVVVAVVTTGCVSGCASRGSIKTEPSVPDLTGIMRVTGRFTLASACPVGPRRVVTSAHVIDPLPFDPNAKLSPVKFQHGNRIGILMPINVERHRDIGEMELMEGEPDLDMWYEIADTYPQAGDTIWLSGWDWRSKRDAFANRTFTAKVLRVVAGVIIFDPAGEPGTSGSCVLNSDGKVVGINEFGKSVGFMGKDEVGGAVLFIKSTVDH